MPPSPPLHERRGERRARRSVAASIYRKLPPARPRRRSPSVPRGDGWRRRRCGDHRPDKSLERRRVHGADDPGSRAPLRVDHQRAGNPARRKQTQSRQELSVAVEQTGIRSSGGPREGDGRGRGVLLVEPDESDAGIAGATRHLGQQGRLGSARTAPAGPGVHHDDVPAQGGEVQRRPLERHALNGVRPGTFPCRPPGDAHRRDVGGRVRARRRRSRFPYRCGGQVASGRREHGCACERYRRAPRSRDGKAQTHPDTLRLGGGTHGRGGTIVRSCTETTPRVLVAAPAARGERRPCWAGCSRWPWSAARRHRTPRILQARVPPLTPPRWPWGRRSTERFRPR